MKTQELRRRIVRAILDGRFGPGEKLPPERELAVRTGVSRVTVRRACDELAASGVLDRRRGAGTFVAARRGANRDAATPTALLGSLSDPFALDFLRALERELAARGELLILRLTEESPELETGAAVELAAHGIRNLVVWPSGGEFPTELFARLRVLGVNQVFFDRMEPGNCADYVGLDNADALRQLFRAAEQARNIAYPVFAGHSDLTASSDLRREEAFCAECAARGLAPRVVRLPRTGEIEIPPELNCADAVFAVNDAMGLRLIDRLKNRPFLCGIDGRTDRFPTVRQPMAELARAAADRLTVQREAGDDWQSATILLRGKIQGVK